MPARVSKKMKVLFNCIAVAGVILTLMGFVFAIVSESVTAGWHLVLLYPGLALIFVYMVFAVVVSFRARFVMGTIITALVALVIVVMANYINVRHFARFDLTKKGEFSLSEKTVAVLKQLDAPLHIVTFFPKQLVGQSQQLSYIYSRIIELLDEYKDYSKYVEVEHIDPLEDPTAVKELKLRLGLGEEKPIAFGVLFKYKDRRRDVTEKEYLERPPNNPMLAQQQAAPKFKGEEAFTNAILSVVEEKQTVVYFTSGNGEKDFQSSSEIQSISQFTDTLKRSNFKVEKLNLLAADEIPADCDVLVMAGPTHPLTKKEILVLENYLANDGDLMVLLDTAIEGVDSYPLLSPLLQKYGIDVGSDIVIEAQEAYQSALNPLTGNYMHHPIVDTILQTEPTLFATARSVEPVQQGSPSGYYATPLVATSRDGSWAETNIKLYKQELRVSFDEEEDRKGPITLAVASALNTNPMLQMQMGQAAPEEGGARLVVYGDADMASDLVYRISRGNELMLLNSINWLAKKEKLISIPPKDIEPERIVLKDNEKKLVFWIIVVGIPFIICVIGFVVWMFRRR